jgi:hypothetical protein
MDNVHQYIGSVMIYKANVKLYNGIVTTNNGILVTCFDDVSINIETEVALFGHKKQSRLNILNRPCKHIV